MQILANNEIFVYAIGTCLLHLLHSLFGLTPLKKNANKYFYITFLFLKSMNKINIQTIVQKFCSVKKCKVFKGVSTLHLFDQNSKNCNIVKYYHLI